MDSRASNGEVAHAQEGTELLRLSRFEEFLRTFCDKRVSNPLPGTSSSLAKKRGRSPFVLPSTGRLSATIDGEDRRSSFEYDSKGRLWKVGIGDATTTTEYDSLGRRTGSVSPLGRITDYGYVATGNLVSVTHYLVVSGATSEAVTSYTYDHSGYGSNLLRVTDGGRKKGTVRALGDSLGTVPLFPAAERLRIPRRALRGITTTTPWEG